MRNSPRAANKPCTDCVLIAANETGDGRRESAAGQSIASRHALPRARSHEPFAKNPLRAETRPGPVAPRGYFRSVSARAVADAVT